MGRRCPGPARGPCSGKRSGVNRRGGKRAPRHRDLSLVERPPTYSGGRLALFGHRRAVLPPSLVSTGLASVIGGRPTELKTMSIRPYRDIHRRSCRKIHVGSVPVGG